jgi:chromosome partitioning protein
MTTPMPDIRPALARTIAVANGKGGVGKTSTCTHCAALLARQGHRVLLVDLDPQGNCAQDLGYTCLGCVRCQEGTPGPAEVPCDFGYGLSQAVQFATHPFIMRDVRPNLDVIPGGGALEELSAVLAARRGAQSYGGDAMLALARVLAPLAADYDAVFIDCPPGHRELQEAALAAAAWLVIPTKTDAASLLGLRTLSGRFVAARQINPGLQLLGVIMFGVTAAAKNARKEATAWAEEALDGTGCRVFTSTIRHVEVPAVRIRKFGMLAHELEVGPEAGVPASVAKSMVGLAGDYEGVAVEMFTELGRKEVAAA